MPLRVLHFSDIHFGQERHKNWEPHDDVRREALADLQRVLADGVIRGKADVVLVTGDIAQRGREEEFKTASDWLKQVREIACEDNALIRTIPGNHDVNLDCLDGTGSLVQDKLRETDDLELIYNYLGTEANKPSNPLSPKLEDYRSFAFAHGSDFPNFGQPFTITKLDLSNGKSLRIIGLCTVLVSDRTDRKGAMILGRNQYVISRDPNCEDIFMMHHPTEWLKDRTEAERYLRSRARVLLTGHEHLPQIVRIERDNGFQQIELAAGALNPPGQEQGFGYTFNWIEFDWIQHATDACLSVTVYPRIWVPSRTRFDADFNRLGGQPMRRVELHCGPKSIPVEAPTASDNSLPGAEEQLSSANTKIVLTLAETDMVPEGLNSAAFERLRFLFWHHLDRRQRIETLIGLGLLTEHARNRLPSGFERIAFEAANDAGKLHDLWDATMRQIPAEEREENPYPEGPEC